MIRVCILFLLLPFLAAQTMDEVEITSEPSHHLALENEYVRVFKVEIAPHAATLMHRHRHDYVFVTLGNANISNEVAGKSPVELKFTDGETRFAAGNFAHVAKNLSAQPFRNITIELLQDEKAGQSSSPLTQDTGEKTFPGGRVKDLFIKDGVLVSEADLEPGATIATHHHNGPHLMVAISDLDLRSDVLGEPSTPWKLKPGDVMWVPAGYTHSLTNAGAQEARFVTLAF